MPKARSGVHCRGSDIVQHLPPLALGRKRTQDLPAFKHGGDAVSTSTDLSRSRRPTHLTCAASQNASIESMTEKARYHHPFRAPVEEHGSVSSNAGQSIRPGGRSSHTARAMSLRATKRPFCAVDSGQHDYHSDPPARAGSPGDAGWPSPARRGHGLRLVPRSGGRPPVLLHPGYDLAVPTIHPQCPGHHPGFGPTDNVYLRHCESLPFRRPAAAESYQ